MTPRFTLTTTNRFDEQSDRPPENVYKQLKQKLLYLSENPRHRSLQTHEVKGAAGDYGGKVFEAYVNEKYRLTWEYGESRGEIVLRNVDNHDECLKNP